MNRKLKKIIYLYFCVCNNIHNIIVFTIFLYQINAALVSNDDF